MSGDASLKVQKALYNALTTALLTAGPGGAPVPVYDHTPQDSGFPYVVLGDSEAGEWDTDTELGQEHRVDIHTFTRDKRGRKYCRELQQKVYDALHDQNGIAIDAGAAIVLLLQTFGTAVLDPDGLTYHGINQFRIITTEA